MARSSVSANTRKMPPRIPAPSHRHASPSGPWPWMDLDSDSDPDSELDPATPPTGDPSKCAHTDIECDDCWVKYPQSLFRNWTPVQVERSGIKNIHVESDESCTCVVHSVDVKQDGRFSAPERQSVLEEGKGTYWKLMQERRPEDIRVRALFVENLSVPVLQMLGTKYNVEPFFWTSSLNWIPSRYQEQVRPLEGDHITITLTFLRAMKLQSPMTAPASPSSGHTASSSPVIVDRKIDTQLPLFLLSHNPTRRDKSSRKDVQMLVLDLLAIHMIRTPDNSTIISYHPTADRYTTSAKRLHSAVCLAGESIYWQNIFRNFEDPTFVLLPILWSALYAWDQALETLWEHICQLELDVMITNNMDFTQELYRIRAHLLHYTSLLDDFRKSVLFVLDTHNPAMDSASRALNRQTSRDLMKKECNNLLMQIERLAESKAMQDKRLNNVMNLVFSNVNIQDSKHMQELTEAALRDSAKMKVLTETAVRDSGAMKQIGYLAMIFLPASFVATVFGMNIRELNPKAPGTLVNYFETAFPLTALTIWILFAFQSEGHPRGNDRGVSMWKRLLRPGTVIYRFWGNWNNIKC